VLVVLAVLFLMALLVVQQSLEWFLQAAAQAVLELQLRLHLLWVAQEAAVGVQIPIPFSMVLHQVFLTQERLPLH
jgi:hypothetical protein